MRSNPEYGVSFLMIALCVFFSGCQPQATESTGTEPVATKEASAADTTPDVATIPSWADVESVNLSTLGGGKYSFTVNGAGPHVRYAFYLLNESNKKVRTTSYGEADTFDFELSEPGIYTVRYFLMKVDENGKEDESVKRFMVTHDESIVVE